jgi:Ca-activated chloride channel family protein
MTLSNFLAPERLWLLALVPLLAGLYAWRQVRRRQSAVRFSNFALLKSVAPKQPAWRRHGPAVAVALALTGMLVGFARPSAVVKIPKEAATVMLVIDVSASMQATDVNPSRLEAAINAADDFVKELPDQMEVGLVSFDRSARVLSTPTTDHAEVRKELAGLQLGPGTAAGDALTVALGAIQQAEAATGQNDSTAAVVLLSDGVTTVGRPVEEAARIAADRGIPVSTIAFGTPGGVVQVAGRIIPVPADPDTMAQVAEITQGSFFQAESGAELSKVYKDISKRVGYDTEQREDSGPVLALSSMLLMGALGLGLLWNGRLV